MKVKKLFDFYYDTLFFTIKLDQAVITSESLITKAQYIRYKEDLEKAIQQKEVIECYMMLQDEPYKTLLRLFYIERLPMEQVASALNYSLSNCHRYLKQINDKDITQEELKQIIGTSKRPLFKN